MGETTDRVRRRINHLDPELSRNWMEWSWCELRGGRKGKAILHHSVFPRSGVILRNTWTVAECQDSSWRKSPDFREVRRNSGEFRYGVVSFDYTLYKSCYFHQSDRIAYQSN